MIKYKHFNLMLFLLCVLSAGCTPKRIITDTREQHRTAEMMQRMDSLFNRNTIVEHDSAWRQEILSQFLAIRESSDTSHTIVVDTAGRVMKETLIINNVREATSETDRKERLVLMHRLEVMDSTLHVMQQQLQHSDSLLQSKQTDRELTVERPLTVWQQVRMRIGEFLIVVSLIVIAVWLLKKRTWWLRIFKR